MLFITPSLTASRVVEVGDFLTPAYIRLIINSLIGTTSPAPTIGPYFVKKGTLWPFKYSIVLSKNYMNESRRLLQPSLNLGV